MGVLDSYVTVGEEASYATPAATLTRGYEAISDPGTREQEYLVGKGMRPGFDATRASRRRPVTLGGSGTLEVDVLNKGMGLLLQAAIGASTPLVGPDGFSFESTSAGPTSSLTVLVHRGRVETAGVLAKGYIGGTVASWEIEQSVGGEDALAKLKLTMDYADEVNDISPATAVFPDADFMFAWPDCQVTVDGNDVDSWDLTLTGDNALKLDRRHNRGDHRKKKPYRNGVPTYGGSFTADYDDDTLYDLFVSGEPVPIVANWVGPDGTGFRVTMAACQFTGDTPVVELGGSSQAAPWVALSDDTNPALLVEYFTADATP